MKTIAVFPNTEKIESAGVLERIKDFFADKDVRLVMLREPAEKFGYPELAVKNKEIDEESALDILIEFIDKTKITKVKNIIKLLSKGLLSLDNASKMLNVMSSLNEIQDKKTNSLYTMFSK